MYWQFWGNYVGPNWTGGVAVAPGERGNTNVDPIDALDAIGRVHDIRYADADDALRAGDVGSYWAQRLAADRALVSDIDALIASLDRNLNPTNYEMFRVAEGVSFAFAVKIKFFDIPNLKDAPMAFETARQVDEWMWRQFPVSEGLRAYISPTYLVPESVSLASADAAKLLIWLTNPSGLILTTDHPAGVLKWGIRFDTAAPAEHHAPIDRQATRL